MLFVCHCLNPQLHTLLYSAYSGELSAVQSDGAADWSWLLVYADARLQATVQTDHDFLSLTDV